MQTILNLVGVVVTTLSAAIAQAGCPHDLIDALKAKELMAAYLTDHQTETYNLADVEIPDHHMLADSCDAWYTANYKRVTGSLHDYHCVHTGRIVLFGFFANQYSFALQDVSHSCPTGYSRYTRLDGLWLNRDEDTRYMKRIEISNDLRQRRIRVWAKCARSYCDWGTAALEREGRVYRAVFQNSRKRVLTLHLSSEGDLLLIAHEYVAGNPVPRVREARFS